MTETSKINQVDSLGRAQGYWEHVSEEGYVLSGSYVDGVRHGLWQDAFPDGRVFAQCYFKNGVQHGEQEIIYNAEVIKTSWENGLAHGRFTKTCLETGEILDVANYYNGVQIK